MMLSEEVAEVCRRLEDVACIFGSLDNPHKAAMVAGVEYYPESFGDQQLVVRTNLGPMNIKLCMRADPDGIRARAKALQKKMKRDGEGGTPQGKECLAASRWEPDMTRPGYSRNRFRDEPDNHQAMLIAYGRD